jgi:hypothetical protein
MEESIADPLPGVTFEVEYRIVAHGNAAAKYYYTQTFEYFAFEKDTDGNLLLLLTENCRGEITDEVVRETVDSLKIDPDNPEEHPHVESIQKK